MWGAGRVAAIWIAGGKVDDESSVFGEENLREVQDCAPPRRGAGDLRESQAQAAAGMNLETGN
jgi:hypothetical protein